MKASFKEEDPLNWAKAVLKHITDMKTRWGKQYKVETDTVYFPDDIATAAGIVVVELESKFEGTRGDLTLANRQLAASKAREAKAAIKIAKLRDEVERLNKNIEDGTTRGFFRRKG